MATVAAPALAVAVSRMFIFGGGAGAGGAARRGVFWFREESALRSTGEDGCNMLPPAAAPPLSLALPLTSVLRGRGTLTWMSSLSSRSGPAPMPAGLLLLNVGGASFSWSCRDGMSDLGGGSL